MPDLVTIRSALLSVSDKTGLVPFAQALASMGVRLISTGGTARALEAAGLKVTPVEALTGFPEGLDGRVKTLHPKVHGGLLAVRDDPSHQAFCREHGIEPIDLLVINLYPFEQTVAKPGVSLEEAIENIDIGGPAMLRAAAKNHADVAVVTSPAQYDIVAASLREHGGATPLSLRQSLALDTYAHTAAYDSAITAFLGSRWGGAGQGFPHHLSLTLAKSDDLRYGENPHQRGALYLDAAFSGPSIVSAAKLHGKEMSYNNINDASSALETVLALYRLAPDQVGACVVKHSTPCGAAVAATTREAVDRAIAGDPLAAYGGILAVNADVDAITARRLCAEGTFLEVVVAPGYTGEALETLRARWANLRILAVGPIPARAGAAGREMRSVPGGMLVQDRDTLLPDVGAWTHAAGPAPSADQLRAAAFLEVIGKSALSNAVVIGGIETGCVRLFGVGAGQVDRLNSCRIAVAKAGEMVKSGGGAVAVSDAFFPFDDGPRVLIDAGVRTIVHPGGSKRDADTLKLCDERGVTCLTTGVRHFRH